MGKKRKKHKHDSSNWVRVDMGPAKHQNKTNSKNYQAALGQAGKFAQRYSRQQSMQGQDGEKVVRHAIDYAGLDKEIEKREEGIKFIVAPDGTKYKTYRAVAQAYGISMSTLSTRMSHGMSLKEALETPVRKRKNVDCGDGTTRKKNVTERPMMKHEEMGYDEEVVKRVQAETGSLLLETPRELHREFWRKKEVATGVWAVKDWQVDGLCNIWPTTDNMAVYYNLPVTFLQWTRKHRKGLRKGVFEPVNAQTDCRYEFRCQMFRNFDCCCAYYGHEPAEVRKRLLDGEELRAILEEPNDHVKARRSVVIGGVAFVFVTEKRMLDYLEITEQDVKDKIEQFDGRKLKYDEALAIVAKQRVLALAPGVKEKWAAESRKIVESKNKQGQDNALAEMIALIDKERDNDAEKEKKEAEDKVEHLMLFRAGDAIESSSGENVDGMKLGETAGAIKARHRAIEKERAEAEKRSRGQDTIERA